jgi:hypothetical protein
MNLAEFMRNAFHVNAPSFAWWAAAIAVLSAFLILCLLLLQTARLKRRFRIAVRHVLAISAPDSPQDGLPTDRFEALGVSFSRERALTEAWLRFQAQCVFRRNRREANGAFTSASASDAFSDETLIDAPLNRSFYQAVPSIITGFGLLVTFLAILVALMDVKISASNEVQGLSNLIGGLSGKFVSSIAALAAATIYSLFEKPLLHGLIASRLQLVTALDSRVPRLSATHLLVEMQRDLEEQSAAFRSFNSDLAPKLRQGISEGMGPTLERMVLVIESLDSSIRAAESTRQQALASSLHGLTDKLEESISQLLSRLSSQFSTDLSGSARTQFDQVAQSLGQTGDLLARMNAQFATTQRGLEDLIGNAKASAVEQMSLGKTQIEELTAVLRGLMAQISEATGRSVTDMSNVLTGAVSELASRVGRLSEDLSAQIASVGQRSTEAAMNVVVGAETWSSRTATRLEELMNSHRDQLGQIDRARDALESSLTAFRNGVTDYTSVGKELRGLLVEANAVAKASVGAADTLRQAQEAAIRAQAVTSSQVEALDVASRRQGEVWSQLQGNLERYADVFGRVETDASHLLTTIGQQLRDFTETTQSHSNALVAAANDHFGSAAQRLKESVETLDEYLQDLSEVLSKASPTVRA